MGTFYLLLSSYISPGSSATPSLSTTATTSEPLIPALDTPLYLPLCIICQKAYIVLSPLSRNHHYYRSPYRGLKTLERDISL